MMPSEFVPFLKSNGAGHLSTPQKPASTSSHTTRDNASAAATFAALVPGNPIAHDTSSPVACAKSPPHAKPVVTLKRDGDHVTHIHIQCGCGEVIELECA